MDNEKIEERFRGIQLHPGWTTLMRIATSGGLVDLRAESLSQLLR